MNAKITVGVLGGLAISLVSAIAYVSTSRPAKPVIVSKQDLSFATRGAASQPTNTPAPAPAAPAEPVAPFSWGQVESTEYRQYIANLRSIGCPEQTIRDIIIADVSKLYADRENPLKIKPKGADGKSTAETPEQEQERLQQLRSVQQEKRWVIKELLEIDIPLDLLPSSGSRDYHAFELALRALPENKRDQVQLLQENYWRQADALQKPGKGKGNADYQRQSWQLGESFREELAKILTPQELEDYDIRTSSTAKQVSTKLASYFGATEDEFRKIYRARREYDLTMERLAVPPAPAVADGPQVDRQTLAQQRAAQKQALEQERSAAQAQMNEQLKTSLGETRYTEYERSQDRNYDLLARLGARYNLPQDTVLQAYDLQKSYNQPMPKVPGPNVATARADRQKEFEERFTAILGEQAARGYRRIHGGSIPLP